MVIVRDSRDLVVLTIPRAFFFKRTGPSSKEIFLRAPETRGWQLERLSQSRTPVATPSAGPGVELGANPVSRSNAV